MHVFSIIFQSIHYSKIFQVVYHSYAHDVNWYYQIVNIVSIWIWSLPWKLRRREAYYVCFSHQQYFDSLFWIFWFIILNILIHYSIFWFSRNWKYYKINIYLNCSANNSILMMTWLFASIFGYSYQKEEIPGSCVSLF